MIKKNAPYILLILVIVLLDFISKLWALSALPYQEDVSVLGQKVMFYLTYNEEYLSGQAIAVLQDANPVQATLQISSVILILCIYVVGISRLDMKSSLKRIGGVLLFFGVAFLLEGVNAFSHSEIDIRTATLITKISVSLFMIVIFLEVKVSILKWALAFIIATGIGNGLNYFYEPYKVIDFIYVEGSYELLRIGVFNIADLSYDIGMLMIIGYAVYSGLKKLQNGVYKLKGRIIKT